MVRTAVVSGLVLAACAAVIAPYAVGVGAPDPAARPDPVADAFVKTDRSTAWQL